MKRYPIIGCNHVTIGARWRQDTRRLLSIAAGITLVWSAQIAMADPIRIACYGSNYDGAPWPNNTFTIVYCSTNGVVLPGSQCSQVAFSPANPVPNYCEDSSQQTGYFCIQTNNIITQYGKTGTPACILNTNNQQYVAQCINWIPFSNTNFALPTGFMTTTPTTNTVCMPPGP